MGKPGHGNMITCLQGVTWGTEISKYPEEKKSNESLLVSDERKEMSLNLIFISGVAGSNDI